jgi:hypothetical protein
MKNKNKIDSWWDIPFSKTEYDAYHAPKKAGLIDKYKQRKIMLEVKAEDFWADCGEKDEPEKEYEELNDPKLFDKK